MATVSKQNGTHQSMVLLGRYDGITIVSTPTRLTRLNYFDGRLLRAENLRAEQQYLRDLNSLSNQGGGAGVVGGFDVSQSSGDALVVAAGLAIDASGNVILLPEQVAVDAQELIDRSSRSIDVAHAVRADEGDFGD